MAKLVLKIDYDRCKGCAMCVAVCPKNVLQIDKKRLNLKGYSPTSLIDAAGCIQCGSCALMCPDVCITIVPED